MANKRWSIWRELLFDHWRWIITVALAILASLQTLRGELSQETQQKFFLSKYLPNWSPWVWISVALAISLSIALERAYHKIDKLQQRIEPDPSVSFFEDRIELNKKFGGLHQELKNMREGSVMWPGGVTAIAFEPETFGHIRRLVMLDPSDDACIAEYSRLFLASPKNAVSTIREVTRRAQEVGVEVRWNPSVHMGLVINDPNGDSSYARAEILLPGGQSMSRPGFLVKKVDNSRMFDKALQPFEYIWSESKMPS